MGEYQISPKNRFLSNKPYNFSQNITEDISITISFIA